MSRLDEIYRPSLAMLTDLYQLTMAYGYWKTGRKDDEAVFHLFFRRNPFKGGWAIACGLEHVVDLLNSFNFSAADVEYLGTLTGNDDQPLFEQGFLDYLGSLKLTCDVDGIPEGTVVFPHEPLLRLKGSLIQCQLLETPLLNMVNFQTLIATKAARICQAARGEPVLEFGLRRAQGVDGALSASRAAYVGGCAATSNVLAGQLFGVPVKGTHAHSWIMCFDDELESFKAYAKAMPNNCVFLVDTFDTLEGVRKACEVGLWLRENGHEMVGVRLDSGDLAQLSIDSRAILDEAGFPDAVIVASNDLDEHRIQTLKEKNATIAVWGVGTRLATAYQQPALGGVYKLAAIKQPGQEWKYRIKLSEQPIKISTPGIQQIRRFTSAGRHCADVIYDVRMGAGDACAATHCLDTSQKRTFDTSYEHHDLLVPVFKDGRCVHDKVDLQTVRDRAAANLSALDPAVRQIDDPDEYWVGLEQRLHNLKMTLIDAARVD